MVGADKKIDSVRRLIADQTAIPLGKIGLESRLLEDLGIDGDDLAELMDRFFQELNVSPHGYDHAAYVRDEGFSLFGRTRRTRSLTVSMLAAAAERGSWD